MTSTHIQKATRMHHLSTSWVFFVFPVLLVPDVLVEACIQYDILDEGLEVPSKNKSAAQHNHRRNVRKIDDDGKVHDQSEKE